MSVRDVCLLTLLFFHCSDNKVDYDTVPTAVFTPVECITPFAPSFCLYFPIVCITRIRYASVGLSQQAAEKKLGVERVDAYHTALTPLESELPLRHDAPPPHGHHAAYLKVVVDTGCTPTTRYLVCQCQCHACVAEDFDRVVGIHMVAPAASEAIQGFALAMKKGLHKRDLDLLVGVHPTVTEAFMNGSLEITKSSGKDPKSKGC